MPCTSTVTWVGSASTSLPWRKWIMAQCSSPPLAPPSELVLRSESLGSPPVERPISIPSRLGASSDRENPIQFSRDLRVEFLLPHESRQDMIIGFLEEVRQFQFGEKPGKKRIEKLVARLDVR